MTARALTRRALLGVLAAGLLAACAPGGSTGAPGGATDAGYVAGDGSFATWTPDERGDAVEHTGTSYSGEEVDLATWRGDVVVMNFWYAACPPCRKEAPDLVALHEDYAGEGVRLLGVNPRDDAGTAQAFERTFAIPYPSLHDEGARAVAAFEGVVPLQAMPTTVVLDRDGRVAARILGQVDPAVLRGLVDDVLAEVA
ncbi:TlpA family protein disulfide reductase [Georgenia muralis]|uniref:Peroxiredoxin n=1 Tax=Georgenia muralis TaxID=154117 RepID=A0A3N4Z6J6_9MICO|nr:TlpA disulfide reductase family protein [Georgenia muralis]RPF27436.1 peroxiredoxin [Georgenia muralis]